MENHLAQLKTELSALRLTSDQQMTDLVAKSSKYQFYVKYCNRMLRMNHLASIIRLDIVEVRVIVWVVEGIDVE